MSAVTIDTTQGQPLEREHELARLDAVLDEAAAGSGRIAFIEAAAGLGKTRLLTAGANAARERGMTVLRARCDELERRFPYGVALQLFEPYLAAADTRERRRVLAGAAAHAEPLLSGRAEPSTTGVPGFALLHGLHWVAANIAVQRPLLLAVDDAHAADEASMRVLLYLAQRLEALPIAIVVTARPRAAVVARGIGGEGFDGDGLVALATHALAERLRLAPLSDATIAAIVRRTLPGADAAFCSACAHATGGNPFFAQELLADLAGSGLAPEREHAARVAEVGPATIARTYVTQLGRLAPGALALARALAVLDETAPLLLTATLAGVDARTARIAADALAAVGVLRPVADLGFVHPIVRRAIYLGIPAAERAQLHLEAADLLRHDLTHGEPHAAEHLLRTLPSDVPWAVGVLHAGARAALDDGDPERAAAYLVRALDERPAARERADVLIDLGRAEALGGHASALDRLHAAVELLDAPADRARALAQLGQALASAGQNADAALAFDEGLALLGDADDELAEQLMAGFLGASRFDLRTRAAAMSRFRALLSGSSEAATPAQRELLAHTAFEHAVTGDVPHEQAIELAERALDGERLLREVGSDGVAYLAAVMTLVTADALARAEEVATAGLEDARDRGSVVGAATMSIVRGFVRYLLGELPRALADLERSGDHGQAFAATRPLGHGVAALALLERGELEASARALDAAEGIGLDHMGSTAYLLFARGRLELTRGDPASALELLIACERRLVAGRSENPAVMPWATNAVIAAMKLDRVDYARELAAVSARKARAFGAPRAVGIALRGEGLATGGEAGLRLLEEAVDVLATSPSRLEHARALVALGAAQRRAGIKARARDTLREAQDQAFRCGADGLVSLARSELLAAGARPRRIAQSGAGALTPSELRVAELATEGLTNREIAQTVFISAKTVEFHLRNAYSKLGIGTRGELVGALDRGE